jgi:hypothetical protein
VLRRGTSVEQFLSLEGGQVAYLTASADGGHFSVSRHVVYDDGDPDFRDISAFTPVDEDEYAGEGVVIGNYSEPGQAVESASGRGGAADRWVNAGMAIDDYWRAKQGG